MSVCFVDDKTGWIAGEASHILHTKDGGQTWEIQFTHNEYMLKKIVFYDENTGWAVGEYGFIYNTIDGGKKWVHQDGKFSFNSDTFEIESGSTLFDIVPITDKKLIAVGIAGVVKKTTDGGETWESVHVGFHPNKPYFTVAAGDDGNTVMIAGKDTIVVSHNGGKTFEEGESIPDIKCRGWIYKIAPRGKAGYVGVGKEGSIYLSDVKGSEWQQVDWIDNINEVKSGVE